MENPNIVSLFQEEVLSKIGAREKTVVERRFGICVHPEHTLEEIGSSLNPRVTRERVRQIQESALINIGRITDGVDFLKDIKKTALDIVSNTNSGVGVIGKERLISETIAKTGLPADDQDVRAVVNTLLHSEYELGKSKPSLGINPFFYSLVNPRVHDVKGMRKSILTSLPKNASMSVEEFYKKVSLLTGVEPSDIASVLELFPDIFVSEGLIALESARVLNPKTLRDKARFILRSSGKAMHFREVAEKIESRWYEATGENVKPATVHNELIRNLEFVLIGRGIYALAEWGYHPGTVLEIVEEILKKAKAPMSVEEILAKVKTKRIVKEATIYMNLQNKSKIVRVGRKLYALAADYKGLEK